MMSEEQVLKERFVGQGLVWGKWELFGLIEAAK